MVDGRNSLLTIFRSMSILHPRFQRQNILNCGLKTSTHPAEHDTPGVCVKWTFHEK